MLAGTANADDILYIAVKKLNEIQLGSGIPSQFEYAMGHFPQVQLT